MKSLLLTLSLVLIGCTELEEGFERPLDDVLPVGELHLRLDGEWTPDYAFTVYEACRKWNFVLKPSRRCSIQPFSRRAVSVRLTPEASVPWVEMESFTVLDWNLRHAESSAMSGIARMLGILEGAECGATSVAPARAGCREHITPEDFALCVQAGAC